VANSELVDYDCAISRGESKKHRGVNGQDHFRISGDQRLRETRGYE